MDTDLTTQQVAAILNLSSRTLKAWRGQGKGPAYRKYGSRIRYTLSDVNAFREASKISHG